MGKIQLNPYPEMNDEYIERLRIVINGYRKVAALYIPPHHEMMIKEMETLDHLAWGLGIGVGVQPGGEIRISEEDDK